MTDSIAIFILFLECVLAVWKVFVCVFVTVRFCAGELRKINISNDGTAQCLYEFKATPTLTTALSLQVNTIDMGAPRMGFALEYNP